jgi:hypothetical protein
MTLLRSREEGDRAALRPRTKALAAFPAEHSQGFHMAAASPAKKKSPAPAPVMVSPSGSSVPTDAEEPIGSQEIAALAYQYWQARGCPDGSPEEDWFRAERELQCRKS